MSKLKQDIEDTLIELIDYGYRIEIDQISRNRMEIMVNPNPPRKKDSPFTIYIKTPTNSLHSYPNKTEKRLDLIEGYLHQCYDLMEMDNYNISDVTLSTGYYSLKVKKLDKSRGKVIESINFEDWENLWDSIDFCLFSSSDDPELFTSIKLDFIKKL